MGVGRSSLSYDEGQMDDDDLHRLRRNLFPDYPDAMNIKSLIRDPVSTVLLRSEQFFSIHSCTLLLLAPMLSIECG